MSRRKILYIPEPTGAGIVRLRKVEIPPTGVDAMEEIAERLVRLERRLALPPRPQQTPRKVRQ